MFIIKNINFKSYNKNKEIIFLKISDKSHLKCFKELYHLVFSNYNFTTKLIENFTNEDLMNNANKLIHFGWKKEAIPVTNVKKSIIAKFFEVLFH